MSPPDLRTRPLRRILAIRLDNIGDVVMLSPALRVLRANYPLAEITLLASSGGRQVAPLLPWVDFVLPWNALWQDISGNVTLDPERELSLAQVLNDFRFDAAFIFTSFSQSPYPPAYLCYLAGIPVRVGQSREFGGGVLTHWVKPLGDEVHQAERNVHLLKAVGLEAPFSSLALTVPFEIQTQARAHFQAAGGDVDAPYLVAAPGASCAARRYDPQRFAQVIQTLARESGLQVLLAGTTREAEAILPFLKPDKKIVSVMGKTSVPELAALIQQACLLVANNSAPMHFAEAFQVPMVILYSGTELESQWAPRASRTTLLRRPTPCTPCHRFTCPYTLECLDIPPEEVVQQVRQLLNLSTPSTFGDMPLPALVPAEIYP